MIYDIPHHGISVFAEKLYSTLFCSLTFSVLSQSFFLPLRYDFVADTAVV
jgi:hypothetical protein